MHLDPNSLHLSQNKYTLDLLHKANMLHAKPYSFPVTTASKLSKLDGDPLTHVTIYRSLVGALEYLTMPDLTDIACAVN